MDKERLWGISTGIYKRAENSPWEPGILLNDGSLGILDKYGRFIDKCWDFRQITGLNITLDVFLDDYCNRYVQTTTFER